MIWNTEVKELRSQLQGLDIALSTALAQRDYARRELDRLRDIIKTRLPDHAESLGLYDGDKP